MPDPADDAGFLTRWSRRKATARDGHTAPDAETAPAEAPTSTHRPTPAGSPTTAAPQREALPTAAPVGVTTPTTAALPPADATTQAPPPPPTLEDAAQLTPQSDFRRFVAPGVSPEVRNAALKQLFTDPHFNLMDGLDIYIDDYGKPDPLPPGMLRKMAQAQFLNLFADEKKAQAEPAAVAAAPTLDAPADEDPDLRLQPHDAAGPPGANPGAGEDAGGQH